MNPVRYWMRIATASNPKRCPQTRDQVISLFTANIIVFLIANSIALLSHILVVALPIIAPIIIIATLVLMVFMMISLFSRMRKVTVWRQKMGEKNKPAE